MGTQSQTLGPAKPPTTQVEHQVSGLQPLFLPSPPAPQVSPDNCCKAHAHLSAAHPLPPHLSALLLPQRLLRDLCLKHSLLSSTLQPLMPLTQPLLALARLRLAFITLHARSSVCLGDACSIT